MCEAFDRNSSQNEKSLAAQSFLKLIESAFV
jgi:hypothetical protein